MDMREFLGLSARRNAALGVAVAAALAAVAHAETVVYSNGFESNATDWSAAVSRVGSGTGGVTSADGSFHGAFQGNTGAFSRWGGYNYGAGGGVATAFQEYKTSVSIFLDVGGGWANDTRFDFSSAINGSDGNFKRDFIFNAGYYNDATGPGANTNRFVISASNNSQPGSAFAKNPGRGPIAISSTGWYTFEHHFYDLAGVLAVDMTIFDASHTAINTWTLSDVADVIGSVGGNRYGWFDYNQFSNLAIDDASMSLLTVVPLPPAAWAGFSTLGGIAVIGTIRRRRLKA
jgi:hypothetical protein